VAHGAREYLEVEEADEEGEEQGLDEPSGDLQRVAELHDARTETEQAPSVEEVGSARDRNLRHVFIAIALVVLLLLLLHDRLPLLELGVAAAAALDPVGVGPAVFRELGQVVVRPEGPDQVLEPFLAVFFARNVAVRLHQVHCATTINKYIFI
jgi:hypothetical protein